ncbi:MAG: 4-hydroxy-3-methylbut-2-enyl diphosphate reductase [Candidatus Palauibacterales bacterium]|nr:4-hydroxy-3-methylbut-2-enyl diphosphate reductase [Candidatus Palauibacterales bacterium]MDP2482486.1 4-hydroxy-3-methylbut-2-enyl diphosphate reductase [Candidatus Palauibacterales bacterium]
MKANGDNYFRRGLGLKAEVKPLLAEAYGSELVQAIKAADYRLTVGRLTFRMARSLGFCYGVDRAVEYAYETCAKFADRRIFLVGEIIHNPHVNQQLQDRGIRFLLPDEDGRFDFSAVQADDVVIIPAFGVKLEDLEALRQIGCIRVDTTCGSVLHVWKRVESYARDGLTAVIHGKHFHEETRATSSQVLRYPGGRYLVVRDMTETELVCGFIRGEVEASVIRKRFVDRASEGFDPARDLERIGVANQTTMLASESLAIAARLAEAMSDRYGSEALPERFRSFDTICSATQDRQDAVKEMMKDPPDAMIVVGGFNSSNTNHLAALCAESTRTYHIESARGIDVETGIITYKSAGGLDVREEKEWLPEGKVEIGLTAGASTPDSLIGETAQNILRLEGLDPAAIGLAPATEPA